MEREKEKEKSDRRTQIFIYELAIIAMRVLRRTMIEIVEYVPELRRGMEEMEKKDEQE